MAVLQYRWRLKIGSASYVDCYPRWDSAETTLVNEAEKNEMFYREKLSAKLTFQRTDFDKINAAPFQTEFRVLVQQNIGGLWQTVSGGRFFKTDFELVDVDNKTIIVTPITNDNYEKVLEGLDKEFNLIDLEPPTVSVNYLRQAVIQVYLPGASFIANFTDGVYWEEPCTPFNTTAEPDGTNDFVNHLAMLNDFGFGLGTGYSTPTDGLNNYARFVIPYSGTSVDVSGVYRCTSYGANDIALNSYERLDGAYTITSYVSSVGNIRIKITRVSDSTIVFQTIEHPLGWSLTGQPPHTEPNVVFISETSSATCEGYGFSPYVRLITNIETVGGDATTLIPDNDPFPHGNFLRALPIDTLNFEMSALHSTTPTRWGKVSEDAIYFGGEYFVKPTTTETLMPVLATTWTGASCWFWMDDDLRQLQKDASEPIKLEHCYKISDVINSLLQEIGASVGHGDGIGFSDFLYAASNEIRGSRLVPVITPKSNVLIGEYDQPAQKAPIRLREVLELLRYFHNAYWYLTSEAFVIEHRHFFDNGKSYTSPGIGVDLTTSLEPRTGLPWSYRTSNYKYDKDRLPERFEFRWMDNVSRPFEGYPINVLSSYVNRGNVEQRQITKFTSDIDFFNVAASDISKDGFVFFECEEDGADLNVPFLEITVSTDESYKLQNGYASFLYAHETYHKHGLPATDVNLNREDIVAETTIRTKNQEIEIALGSEIDPYLLITSNLGDGKIEKIEQNLSSKSLKLTIKHDTE